MTLEKLRWMLASLGATQIYVKELAPNDNSKNQPYLSRGDLQALNIFPVGAFRIEDGDKRANLKAPFPLSWLRLDGSVSPAPTAQLIVYHKYPEVRLSGFLKGVVDGPNNLMTTRQAGRLLFLAVAGRRILGWVAGPESSVSNQFQSIRADLNRLGVFWILPQQGTADPRSKLLGELLRIHRLGWIDAQRLSRAGLTPCRGQNCGGCTLEAQLGITANSSSRPDFEGWEVKGHSARRFGLPPTGPVTLMTPAPTDGLYKSLGLEGFLGRFGYWDRNNSARRNFSSPHRIGKQNSKTLLSLKVEGYDPSTGRILDANGSVLLRSQNGEVAASWRFSDLMNHWTIKHARAAFVPYIKAPEDPLRYSYSSHISLAEGTDFTLFLKALATGLVVYDPGIWRISDKDKRERSQFRIPAKHLHTLYHSCQPVDLSGE